MTVPDRSSLGRRMEYLKIGVSPSGKAPGFDPGIRRFESCHPSQFRAKKTANLLPFRGG